MIEECAQVGGNTALFAVCLLNKIPLVGHKGIRKVQNKFETFTKSLIKFHICFNYWCFRESQSLCKSLLVLALNLQSP